LAVRLIDEQFVVFLHENSYGGIIYIY